MLRSLTLAAALTGLTTISVFAGSHTHKMEYTTPGQTMDFAFGTLQPVGRLTSAATLRLASRYPSHEVTTFGAGFDLGAYDVDRSFSVSINDVSLGRFHCGINGNFGGTRMTSCEENTAPIQFFGGGFVFDHEITLTPSLLNALKPNDPVMVKVNFSDYVSLGEAPGPDVLTATFSHSALSAPAAIPLPGGMALMLVGVGALALHRGRVARKGG